MRALARVGRDVNAMEEGNQRTALHYAAGYGDCATARALVHSGAHVNARDRAGHDHARLHLTLTLTLTVTLNVTLTLTLTLTAGRGRGVLPQPTVDAGDPNPNTNPNLNLHGRQALRWVGPHKPRRVLATRVTDGGGHVAHPLPRTVRVRVSQP